MTATSNRAGNDMEQDGWRVPPAQKDRAAHAARILIPSGQRTRLMPSTLSTAMDVITMAVGNTAV